MHQLFSTYSPGYRNIEIDLQVGRLRHKTNKKREKIGIGVVPLIWRKTKKKFLSSEELFLDFNKCNPPEKRRRVTNSSSSFKQRRTIS